MKVRNLLALMLSLLLMLSLAACGGSAKSEAAMDNMAMEVPGAPAEMYGDTVAESKSESGTAASLPTDRKLIRTVRMEAETEDMDILLSALEEKLAALGGYVQAREIYNGSTWSDRRYRHGEITLRIPAENLNSFTDHVEEKSNVVTSSETIDDVTTQYVDTESHIAALKIEQERLLELLAKAETMEDILVIEARLTDVRYELENYTSQLRLLDNKVTYATLHLYITEVQEYTPIIEKEPTAWERIRDGFADSIEDITEGVKEFGIWLLVNSPYLVIWAVVLVFGGKLLKKVKFRKRVKSAPRKDTEEKPE